MTQVKKSQIVKVFLGPQKSKCMFKFIASFLQNIIYFFQLFMEANFHGFRRIIGMNIQVHQVQRILVRSFEST